MPFKYQKKPLVIEAFQYTGQTDNTEAYPTWLLKALASDPDKPGAVRQHPMFPDRLQVVTLEGPMIVDENDWIIKGVKDELYPCKPDIFEATYDKVDED